MTSLTKIRGRVMNTSGVVEALYANQAPTQGSAEQASQILFYDENGTPTGSDELTFDGTTMTVDADLFVTGPVQQSVGNVVFQGALGCDSPTSFANGLGVTTATAGPRLTYRGQTMPVYWTTQFLCGGPTGFNTFVGITGTSPNWVTARADYFFIDGPYIASPETTTTMVNNADPAANAEFFPLSAIVSNYPIINFPTGGKIDCVAIVGRADNNNVGRVSVGILFVPR